eukprot:gene7430-biopygen12053
MGHRQKRQLATREVKSFLGGGGSQQPQKDGRSSHRVCASNHDGWTHKNRTTSDTGRQWFEVHIVSTPPPPPTKPGFPDLMLRGTTLFRCPPGSGVALTGVVACGLWSGPFPRLSLPSK